MSDAIKLFLQFLALGLTSFGGPAAHLGYFRKVFVEQKKWLSESEYSQFVALSQFLPGPGSSQVGFAIGLKRMGGLGGLLAFIGFTLPSFILMYVLALGIDEFQSDEYIGSLIHVFKLLAVIVVFDAALSMSKTFCRDKISIFLAIFTAIIILMVPIAQIQLLCLCVCGFIGYFILSNAPDNKTVSDPAHYSQSFPSLFRLMSRRTVSFLLIFLVIFLLSVSNVFSFISIFSETFVAGSLVFGGGHVVLPLLQDAFVGNVGQENFIAGYAAAQAVPGPMFTFATYLGTLSHSNPLLGAVLATVGVFLPGFLLILAFHKQWLLFANHPKVSGFIMGVNASVVGLLSATLINPIISSSVLSLLDIVVVAIGFTLLRWLKLPIMYLIILASFYAMLSIWFML